MTTETEPQPRVIVTNPIVGICYMQVVHGRCDLQDHELLDSEEEG